MYLIKSIFIISIIIKTASCGNILFVSQICSPSHHLWNKALAMGLIEKGHNVTLIGPDKDKNPDPQNYTSILLEGVYEQISDHLNINEWVDYGSWATLMGCYDWRFTQCELFTKTKGLQHLLNYPKDFKFDLIIMDLTAGTCLYPLLERFNYPPSVGVTAFLLPQYVAYSYGNHLYPAYIPWFAIPYTSKMGFVDRVWNYIYTYLDALLTNTYVYYKEGQIARTAFGNNIPSMHELERHISLVLTNTDPVMDFPQPLVPSLIPVGGLHTRDAKKLPQDLEALMAKAKDGVVIFSLGTNVRSDKLDAEKQRALLSAFSKIPQLVIWKFESEILDLPSNVIVRKWLPQTDLLGHPNTKLFIGHGGALSTQEAIYHAVPMIGIPFMVDQHINTRLIAEKGIGLKLDYAQINAESVSAALTEILRNPIYRENMKALSRRFRDRPETPLQRGIFWIEYVLRHGGAQFLNTPGRDMPFYAASGADVLIFLILLSIIAVLILYSLVKCVLLLLRKRDKVKTN